MYVVEKQSMDMKVKFKYKTEKLVEETLFVCDRHQQIFEEFMNEQGEYQ